LKNVPNQSAPRPLIDQLKQLPLTRWLLLAAVFHVTFTLSVFLIGHFRLLPNHFDKNGIGISFAVDGVVYQQLDADLANALRDRGIGVWYNVQAPLHCRLYSLTFIFPGSIVGYNILAAEVFNLIYYLSLLIVVYLLGREIFDASTGLISAGIIAVWPSFLFHSTQLIRDPASVLLMLAWMLILVVLLRRTLAWRQSLWIALASIAVLIVFWAIRGNVWNVVVVSIAITILLFVIRSARERKLLLPNLVLLVVISAGVFTVPTQIQSTTISGVKAPTSLITIPTGTNQSSHNMWWRLGYQIRARRLGFFVYGAQGSNIDADVDFHTAGDIIRYLPRSAVIGFFAPFPRMWFEAGISGRSARLLAAAETLAMYVLYVPMLFCVWKERRKLSVWLIFLTSSVALIALGLVVANAGALYRLRYAFWMMMIVLAVRGLELLRAR
jgi:hypothetical protein